MRDRGREQRRRDLDDIAEMRRLTAEAIAAGAVGVSTSRTIFHRSISGGAVPGTYATDVELTELARGMADGGGGVFEAITSSSIGNMAQLGGERFSQDHELHLLADVVARVGAEADVHDGAARRRRRSVARGARLRGRRERVGRVISFRRSRHGRSAFSAGSPVTTRSCVARRTSRSRGCRSRRRPSGCAIPP